MLHALKKRLTRAEPVLTALLSRQKEGRTHRTQPIGRGHSGSKHHIITDRNEIPLVRYERRADIHLAFFTLAATLIAFKLC